ncbi:3-isopropylmalate dehydratase small subunit [Buchnera aphidicola (Formosaphis micheliae)]|uniref:3-isopropylmalate dehydratase small subunit n=1 Tax=Buchnera aphidicola TaxID=9 RepID=UPI0031B83B17
MTVLNQFTGIVLPIDMSNIDTDIIIPKQFLQKITRQGFGRYLFYNWRFNDNYGKEINNNFILNKPCYKNASILLTRDNFGCGSSREHAVWALIDYGIKVILSSSFSDIFYNNSINNQLVPITLSKQEIENLFKISVNKVGIQFTIDFKNNIIIADKQIYYFKINKLHKFCIMNKLDPIDLTLQHIQKINDYEKNIFDFFTSK